MSNYLAEREVKSAILDNKLLLFLTKYCMEEENFSTPIKQVYNRYHDLETFDLLRVQEPEEMPQHFSRSGRNMTYYLLEKKLIEAGFDVQKDIVLKTKIVYGLLVDTDKVFRDLEVANQIIPAPVEEEKPKIQEIEVLKKTHVRVGDQVLHRDIIATVKKIRGFMRSTSPGVEEFCQYIVTFTNGEMRHKFITQEEYDDLMEDLQFG
jgi:hypothetical protein